MHLNFKTIGQGKPLIILHGLFGMLDNWQSVAKALENNYTLYLIDQRNHGKSPHTDQHSYTLMAEDLRAFMLQHGIPQSNILGHSMGGKTAMQFALDFPEMVEKLIVVDIGVKRYDSGHDHIFDALQQVQLVNIHSRHEAETQLAAYIHQPGVQQFLLKNLTRQQNGTYVWKFNLQTLIYNYSDYILSAIEGDIPYEGETLFIRGEKSDYISNNDWPQIQKLFPQATLTTVADAGHWVHADNPQALITIIQSFLN